MEVLQINIKSGGHPVSDSCNYARTYIPHNGRIHADDGSQAGNG